MPRRYRISRNMKRIQMRLARHTRIKRYGKYLSSAGIEKVKRNLDMARMKRWRRKI